MTDTIKDRAMQLAIQANPGMPAYSLVEEAKQIEAYLREGGADAPPPYVKYRDAPAQTIALDEAEERDDE